MLPIDAYEMLYAIAQMHNRTDKLKKNEANKSDQEVQKDCDYTVDALFPNQTEERALYNRIKNMALSVEPELVESPRQNYVTFKKEGNNTVSVWPKSGWVEVVLNAKTGQLKDDVDLLYDITNRKWSAAHYAFRYSEETDDKAAMGLIRQTIDLKNKK